ncbi:MAG: hypothetical protein ACYC7E_09620 [Armatimonadota bacterium]
MGRPLRRAGLPALIAACCLLFIQAGFAAGKLAVTPWPNKLLYTSGETATFTVSLANAGEAVSGTLVTSVYWEMTDRLELARQPFSLQSGEKTALTVRWPKLPDVLGCEVRAEALDAHGAALAAGSEYFSICGRRDVLRVGIHGCAGLMTFGHEAFLRGVPAKILEFRRGYMNILEYFNGRSYSLNLAPDEEEYPSKFWISKKGLLAMAREARAHGMLGVSYVTSYGSYGIDEVDIALRHPEWVAYNDRGQPDSGYNARGEELYRLRAQRETSYETDVMPSLNLNWLDGTLLEYHIDQLIANKAMFDMDGVRYDGEPGQIWGAFDVTGKPMPGPEVRAKERIRIVNRIKERVRKAYPDYLLMFNAGAAVGLEKMPDLENGVLDPQLRPLIVDGGALCDEEVRLACDAYNRFHEWKKYATLMVSDVDLTRKEGGFAYVIFPYPWSVHRNSTELGFSIMLAAGHHPWYAMPHNRDAKSPGGTHFPIQQELFAFATRYSALLWGRGIDRVRAPEETVTVSSPTGQIWWREYVHRRTLPDGRTYLIVHLLNAPPTKEIGVLTQPLPDPIRDVQVRFSVPVNTVWAATARPGPGLPQPEGGEACGPMRVETLPVTQGQAVLPDLRVWTMIVAELAK